MRIMEINEEAINQLVLEKVDEHIRSLELEEDVYFMDARQLEKYLSLSWPTISKVFLSDPDFPTLKRGNATCSIKKTLIVTWIATMRN